MKRTVAILSVLFLLLFGVAPTANAGTPPVVSDASVVQVDETIEVERVVTVYKTGTCTWIRVAANPPYMGCFQWWLYDCNWWEETFGNCKDHWSHVLIKRAYLY